MTADSKWALRWPQWALSNPSVFLQRTLTPATFHTFSSPQPPTPFSLFLSSAKNLASYFPEKT